MHQVAPLDFDKRKGLMSLLESRNDVVRHDRQWRYKFIASECFYRQSDDAHQCSVAWQHEVSAIPHKQSNDNYSFC
jgi:hypothetical protein